MESGTDIVEIYLNNVFDGAWPFVLRTSGLASFVKFFFSCLNLMFEPGRLSKSSSIPVLCQEKCLMIIVL